MIAKVDIIGKWSVNKLDMLRRYLAAYTSILNTDKNKKWCQGCIYIDAFAGSIYPIEKESDDIVAGSPLVALRTIPEFNEFIFIDIDNKRLTENIEPLKIKFKNKNIKTHCGDANKIIINEILPRFHGRESRYRGFIFLDPYGLELKWRTVELIGMNKAYDVFVNFSIMGVVRQLKNDSPLEYMIPKLNAVFGNDEWRKLSYIEDKQLHLFEKEQNRILRRKENLVISLVEFYRARLKTVFTYVSEAIIMRNKNNGPLYSLILASHAKLAIEKMHEIFKKYNK